jgi:integrating conjugative element protein (TIGR03752 family)
MQSNRILPVLAIVVLMMLVFIGVKSCRQDAPQTATLTEVPTPGTPDADSPADTIRTLTAEVAELKNQNKKMQQYNEQLIRQREEIARDVKQELVNEISKKQQQQESSLMSGLTQQLDFFKSRLDELSHQQSQATIQPDSLASGDIPVGFGLDGQDSFGNEPEKLVWVEPLGTGTDAQGKPVYTPAQDFDSESLLNTAQAAAPGVTERYLNGKPETSAPDKTPAYTVPRNATLIGSTGMTALIGRIPINGTVEDPFPFKVIVGKDNLAANGIDIPGLDGMIFSGKATGDWTLSCVRGQLHSVTYVFADGTIRTLSSDDQSGELMQGQSRQGQDRTLGWISDRRGIPCVTGERISNAATYLGGQVLAAGVEAAASAFAQSETTNIVSPVLGTTTSVITGDAAKFAAGRALSGGAEEISQYLRERLAQSFDVIYVDTGRELAVHVDIELPIDYEHNGRKTTYAYSENSADFDLD